MSKTGFPNLGTVDILVEIILRGEGCPVHGRMFSGFPGLRPPDAGTKAPKF